MQKIDKAKVRTTYNGRLGCACGCGGTYAQAGAAVTRRVNLINNNLDKVEVMSGLNGETIYMLEDLERGRATRVYVSA